MFSVQVFKMFSSPIIDDSSKDGGDKQWDGTVGNGGQGAANSGEKHVMTYDDFVATYVAFKEKKDEEMQ